MLDHTANIGARTTDRRAAGLPVGESWDGCKGRARWDGRAGRSSLRPCETQADECSYVGPVLNGAATLLATHPPLYDPGSSLAGVDPCGLGDATIVREAIARDVAPRAGGLVSAEGALHECFWDGHTAWIQVALQPMHASVWDRRNVEYLDLGGEGYSFRKTTAPGVCDITYVHKSKGGSPYDGEVVG